MNTPTPPTSDAIAPCPVCHTRGYVGTGIDEAPTTNCNYCDGTGYRAREIAAQPGEGRKITEADVLAACNAYDSERTGEDMAEYPAMYKALETFCSPPHVADALDGERLIRIAIAKIEGDDPQKLLKLKGIADDLRAIAARAEAGDTVP